MSFTINLPAKFKRDLKPLIKKYPSLAKEIEALR